MLDSADAEHFYHCQKSSRMVLSLKKDSHRARVVQGPILMKLMQTLMSSLHFPLCNGWLGLKFTCEQCKKGEKKKRERQEETVLKYQA